MSEPAMTTAALYRGREHRRVGTATSWLHMTMLGIDCPHALLQTDGWLLEEKPTAARVLQRYQPIA